MPTTLKKPAAVSRHRTTILLVVLLVVGLAAGLPYLRRLQEQRLSHASLEELRASASAPAAGSLVHLLYGEKLAHTDQFTEALTEFKQAEKSLEPDQKDSVAERVFAQLGYTLTRLGDDDTAITYLKKASQINDEDLTVYLGYANIFIHRRLFKSAIAQLKLAVALDPHSVDAHYLLGKAYDENAEPLGAVEELKTAVAMAPNSAAAHEELGHSYAYQANFPLAIEQFSKALELSPNNKDYRRALGAALGMGARSREQYLKAVEILGQTVQEEPNNDSLIFTLGQLHLRFQNLEEARRLLKRAVEIKPNYTEAWYNLARVEQLLGNTAEEKRATALFKKFSDLHSNAIISEKKVSSNPKDPNIRLELSRRYHEAGNIVGAYWQLKTAIAIKSDFSEAVQAMPQIQREYEAAIARQGNVLLKRDAANAYGPPPPAEFMTSDSALLSVPKR